MFKLYNRIKNNLKKVCNTKISRIFVKEITNKTIEIMETKKEILAYFKEKGKTFFADTKKHFKSCTFACINVDDYELRSIWGDFKTKKDAIAVIRLWSRVFKSNEVECVIFEGKYRISIDF